MDRTTALQILSLEEGFTAAQLKSSYDQKISAIAERLENARIPKLRAQYEAALQEAEAAHALLKGKPVAAGGGAAHLSATKLADLPQAGPSYTQFSGSAALAAGAAGSEGAAGATSTALRVGQVLCGRYELRERIGTGGMGEVFRALDRTRGEDIALKVLLPHLLQHPVARERFAAEAKISITLAHPNIVNVFDLQREGDYSFLTMELLHGQPLRDLMNARAASRSPFSPAEAVLLAQEIGDALHYAHKQTVHRDVKPENIWVCDDSHAGARYKLMDFGIARLMSNSQMNQTRTAMGTAYYMAPEQLLTGIEVDGRADQYSLAVLLYELVAGEKPMGRVKSLRERNSKVPRAFSEAVDKALSSRPHERFATMAAFVHALAGKGGSLPLNLNKTTISAVAGGVVLVGVAVLFPGWTAYLPNSSQKTEARNQAIQAQGIAESLLKKLESKERDLDSAARDARSNTDRLDNALRTARTDAERADLTDRLAKAKQAQQVAEEVKSLATTIVFGPEAMGGVRGQINVGGDFLRNKQALDAAETMLAAQKEAERLLDLSNQIPEAVQSRLQMEKLIAGMQAFNKSEGGKYDVAAPQAALDSAVKLMNSGKFTEGKQALAKALQDHGAAFNKQLDELIARYGQLAEKATNEQKFSIAEEALQQAKRLSAMKGK